MKTLSLCLGVISLMIGSLSSLSIEPFKYKYEITSNSKSAKDIYQLYDYKERLIDIYDEHFLMLNEKERENKLVNDISLFEFSEDIKSYYVSGTIVLLVGNANGMTIRGDLRQNSCDETVIRTKIILFDIFR